MSLTAGTVLGPYEIVELLGAGGMGEVYRARDSRLKRSVAIKVIRSELAADPDRRRRFVQEAEAAAALNHPNVIAVHDIGDHEGSPYIVSELLDGRALRDEIRPGVPWPVDRALDVASQMAKGLGAAHARHLVHRDVKPENVFITRDGTVKMLDFGLVKLQSGVRDREDTSTMAGTSAGVVLGTQGYVAPEQLRAQDVDARADIFSLGAVLYELLTGMRAFQGASAADLQTAILTQDPPSPSTTAATPTVVDRLVRRCLMKAREERFQSMADLVFAIETVASALSSGNVTSTASVDVRAAKPWARVVPWGIAMVSMAVAVAAVIVGPPRKTMTKPAAVRAALRPPPDTTFTRQTPVISPDGRYVAMAATAADGTSSLWFYELATGEYRRVEGTNLTGNATSASPFWSPDSQSLAFYSGGQLKRVQVSGGRPVTLASSSISYGGAWTGDNRILFNAGNNQPISAISASGGTLTPAVTLNRQTGEYLHGWPALVPETNWFLFFVSGPSAVRGIHAARLGSTDHRLALSTAQAGVYSAGHVLVVRESTLEAHKFDRVSGEVAREGIAIATQVGTNSNSRGIMVSSSESHLIYGGASQDLSRLIEYSRDGRVLREVGVARSFARFSVNPAGTVAVEDRPDPITGNFSLWSVRLNDGIASRISTDEMSEHNPQMDQDGKSVVYQWNRDGGGQLYRRPIDGAGTATFIGSAGVLSVPSDVSPDGQTLVFTTQGIDYDIYVVRMNGSGPPTPWRKTRFNETGARFSPDGKWLAYQSDETGRTEIFVEAFSHEGRRQISKDGGTSPLWSSNGQELFFVDRENRLMRIGITSPVVAQGSEPAPLFALPRVGTFSGTLPGYAVLPGSRSFLVRVGVEDPLPYTLLLNWTSVLPE